MGEGWEVLLKDGINLVKLLNKRSEARMGSIGLPRGLREEQHNRRDCVQCLDGRARLPGQSHTPSPPPRAEPHPESSARPADPNTIVSPVSGNSGVLQQIHKGNFPSPVLRLLRLCLCSHSKESGLPTPGV